MASVPYLRERYVIVLIIFYPLFLRKTALYTALQMAIHIYLTRRTYRCCIKRPFTDQSFYKLKLILDFYFISGALRESASIMDVRTLMGGGVSGQLTPNVPGPVGEGYSTGQGHALTLRKTIFYHFVLLW